MAEVIRSKKALAVNPLKASQPLGATLAFLGIDQALPILHGSQGCSAFAKVFLVRHFREAIPLQTTAMDQTTTVMGADDNLLTGLKTVLEKRKPALIGVPTTGLSETQGSDVNRLVREFYQQNPEAKGVPVIPVLTPDYVGGLETGYALAVEALLKQLVPASEQAGQQPRQVNLLVSSMLTAADLDYLRRVLEAFGLTPVILPDLGRSLDGHMTEADFVPVTTGGTPVEDFARLGQAGLTLVIGRSLKAAGQWLQQQTGVPSLYFDGLMGLQASDRLIHTLHQHTGRAVPEWIERQRSQCQDAQLDSHFMLGMARIALAAEPDLLLSFSQLCQEMGAEIVAAVSPQAAEGLSDVHAEQVIIGDLDDLQQRAQAHRAQLVIGNAHAARPAQQLGIPLLRAGWPIYDRLGAQHQLWIGHQGTRDTLFALANRVLEGEHSASPQPYQSIYATTQARSVDHATSEVGTRH